MDDKTLKKLSEFLWDKGIPFSSNEIYFNLKKFFKKKVPVVESDWEDQYWREITDDYVGDT